MTRSNDMSIEELDFSKIDCRDRKAPVSLRGLISESHNCVDCGHAHGLGSSWGEMLHFDHRSEVYMVRNAVWKKTGLAGYGGCLCIGCLYANLF
jgi:hypothetical protein